MNTLGTNSMKKVSIWKDQYTVGNRSSDNLLLMVILRESGLDTKTTAAFLRRSLIQLDEYMIKVQDNILKFNLHVKQCMQSLRERGETSNDLFINVSKAYLSCRDKTFSKYIQSMLDRDEDDMENNLTVDRLMLKGANKYKSLLQNGKWKEPTKIDRELMAISTEIAKLKNETKYKKDKDTPAITTKQSNRRIPPQHWRNRLQWLRNHIPPDNMKEIRK